MARELLPGVNHYLLPLQKELEIISSFVDRNTYFYRLVDGKKLLKGVAFGPGWEDQRFNPNCEKGAETMSNRRGAPPPEELRRLWQKHLAINPIAKELGTSWMRAKEWLLEAGIINSFGMTLIQQAQPAPEPAAKPETGDADKAEPAGTSITQIKDASEQKPADWDTLWPLAQELKSRGLTWAQVADELGVSYYSLKHKIDRERKRANQHAPVLDRFKVRWIQDVMAEDLEPGVQLALVAAVQALNVPEVGDAK